MALKGKLPDHWLNCDVELSFGPPIPDRNGSIKYNSFNTKILVDHEFMLELDTSEKVRLYPKDEVKYLSKAKAVATYSAADMPASKLIISDR